MSYLDDRHNGGSDIICSSKAVLDNSLIGQDFKSGFLSLGLHRFLTLLTMVESKDTCEKVWA